jgi:predicted site-specific integrase-resolvase
MKELFSRTQVAKYFSVNYMTVYGWEKSGKLKPDCYVSGRPMYSKESIDNLKEASLKQN